MGPAGLRESSYTLSESVDDKNGSVSERYTLFSDSGIRSSNSWFQNGNASTNAEQFGVGGTAVSASKAAGGHTHAL